MYGFEDLAGRDGYGFPPPALTNKMYANWQGLSAAAESALFSQRGERRLRGVVAARLRLPVGKRRLHAAHSRRAQLREIHQRGDELFLWRSLRAVRENPAGRIRRRPGGLSADRGRRCGRANPIDAAVAPCGRWSRRGEVDCAPERSAAERRQRRTLHDGYLAECRDIARVARAAEGERPRQNPAAAYCAVGVCLMKIYEGEKAIGTKRTLQANAVSIVQVYRRNSSYAMKMQYRCHSRTRSRRR